MAEGPSSSSQGGGSHETGDLSPRTSNVREQDRASDKCLKEKRKTVNGDDLLCAMGTLGFEDYIGPLKLYMNKYREMEGSGKGQEGSARKDGVQSDPNAQLGDQGLFFEDLDYGNLQELLDD